MKTYKLYAPEPGYNENNELRTHIIDTSENKNTTTLCGINIKERLLGYRLGKEIQNEILNLVCKKCLKIYNKDKQ